MKIGAYNNNYTVLIGIRGNILENVFNWKFRFHESEVKFHPTLHSFSSLHHNPTPKFLNQVLECYPNGSGRMPITKCRLNRNIFVCFKRIGSVKGKANFTDICVLCCAVLGSGLCSGSWLLQLSSCIYQFVGSLYAKFDVKQ